MIVTCPSCKRKFRLDDNLIRAPYQKLRCSLCSHIFVYESDVSRRPEPEEDFFQAAQEETFERPKKRKPIALFIVAAIVIIGLGAAASFYWLNYLGAGDRWLKIRKVEGQETIVRDGRIFFVQGTIANGSTKARKYVIVKAKLFDTQGGVIGEHFGLAGLGLSRQEAEQMRRADIEGKISEFRKSNVTAFVLQRNGELPFVIVFPDSYSGKPKDFTVEIIESPLL